MADEYSFLTVERIKQMKQKESKIEQLLSLGIVLGFAVFLLGVIINFAAGFDDNVLT